MSAENLSLFERIRFRGSPVANPESVVSFANVRFTLLTPRLVRLEWSETGQFEDRGSYAFPTRHAEAIPFEVRQQGPDTLIDTGALAEIEVEIAELVDAATTAARGAPVTPVAADALEALADLVASRER